MNAKQRRFVAEYLVDLNATKAAERAGYSKRTANEQGSRLLAKASVAAAVKAGQQRKLDKLDISAAHVIQELARIGFSDIRHWFDTNGNLRPIHELEDDVAAAIGSVEVLREKTKTRTGDKETETTQESTIKIKAWDKGRALELLAKHFGLVKEHHEHTGKDGHPIETRVVFGGRYKP